MVEGREQIDLPQINPETEDAHKELELQVGLRAERKISEEKDSIISKLKQDVVSLEGDLKKQKLLLELQSIQYEERITQLMLEVSDAKGHAERSQMLAYPNKLQLEIAELKAEVKHLQEQLLGELSRRKAAQYEVIQKAQQICELQEQLVDKERSASDLQCDFARSTSAAGRKLVLPGPSMDCQATSADDLPRSCQANIQSAPSTPIPSARQVKVLSQVPPRYYGFRNKGVYDQIGAIVSPRIPMLSPVPSFKASSQRTLGSSTPARNFEYYQNASPVQTIATPRSMAAGSHCSNHTSFQGSIKSSLGHVVISSRGLTQSPRAAASVSLPSGLFMERSHY
jgi:hypothetical protein